MKLFRVFYLNTALNNGRLMRALVKADNIEQVPEAFYERHQRFCKITKIEPYEDG
jgi:hypothetical protein